MPKRFGRHPIVSDIHGRYWYFIENVGQVEEKNGETLLYVSLPITRTGQKISNLKIFPEPLEIISDAVNGNRVALWRKAGFKEGGAAAFYYDFDLQYSEVNLDIRAEEILPCDAKSEEYLKYTSSEPWVEISEPIKTKALTITGEEKNSYKRVLLLFDWVIDNMSYEYPDISLRGAKTSFERLRGDCGEFARVFVALCRAVNIPARTITSKWLESGGHVWAEVYLPPYGWVPADTTLAHALKTNLSGVTPEWFKKVTGVEVFKPEWLLGNIYPKRLIVAVGDNIKLISEKLKKEKVFSYLQPGGVHAHPDGVECLGFSVKPVHDGFYIFGDRSTDEKYALELASMELAESYFENKMYSKAETGFLGKLAKKPSNSETWLFLGRVYQATARYRKAIDAFNSAITGTGGTLKPVWEALAHFYAGNCYDLMAERAAAIEQYETVLKSGIAYEGLPERAKRCLESPHAI